MASEAQIEANRRNAQKSTGPKSPEGKAIIRMNALRHGLRAETAVLPLEDVEEFNKLRDSLEAEVRPVGQRERMLFQDILMNFWRLERAQIISTSLVSAQCATAEKRAKYVDLDPENPHDILSLAFDRSRLSQEYVGRQEMRHRNAYYRAAAELVRLQTARAEKERQLRENQPQSIPEPVVSPTEN